MKPSSSIPKINNSMVPFSPTIFKSKRNTILSKPFTFQNPIKLLVSSHPNNDYISRNNSTVVSPSTRSNSKLKISQEFLHIDKYLNVEDSKELSDQADNDSQGSKESYSEGNQEIKHYEVLNYKEIKKI